jgi:hypothetical protein
MREKFAEAGVVGELAGGAVEDQQSGTISVGSGEASDQPIREVESEVSS